MHPDPMDSISRLMHILHPPDEPTRPARADEWADLEADLGIAFPSDFKTYLARYGSGEINAFLLVSSPAFGNSLTRLQQIIGTRLEIRRAIRDSDWHVPPYPVFPEEGGVLPWGITRNGDTCFWVTDPAASPNDWPVVVVESKSQEWLDHGGPMTAFLADLLDGTIQVPFFPQGYFGSGGSFVPLDVIRDQAEP
jgi:hypothetical protein